MNKKFSTLLVGALLTVTGVGSVSAQVELEKTDGTYNDKLYQITVSDNQDSVIVMSKRADGLDSLYVKNRATLDADELANSLWCVAVTETSDRGRSFIYDFRNKATGKKLAIDINPNWIRNTASGDTLAVGVDLDGWAFSEAAPKLSDNRPMYVYIPDKDSVAALVWDQTGTRGGLEAMKVYAHADTIADQVTKKGFVFSLREPEHLTLDAHAMHTLLGSADSAAIQLSFWKTIDGKEVEIKNATDKEDKIVGNIFGQPLIAHDTTSTALGKAVYFTTVKGTYLRADSAWRNESGTLFPVLTDTTTAVTYNADVAAGTAGQYVFQVNYAPSNDSLYIRVDSAFYAESLKAPFDIKTGDPDSTYVILQDLEPNVKWALTVGKDSTATHIKLGFGNCSDAVDLNRTSLADGLYTIKDLTTGKYYAYPLYGNGDILEWVEIDEASQLTAHMPAYQWVIDRTYDDGDLAETSPITIENREYAGNKITVQLYEEDGKIIARTGALAGANLEIKEISKEDYPEAYNDKYLGYYHRPAADIEYNINKYVFKYFHPYALDDEARYLTIGGETDSLLYAKEMENGTNFELQSFESKEYHYGVGNPSLNDENYAKTIYGKIGIARLYRTAYVIAREGAVMDSIMNKKYAMAQREYLTEVDSFYMKANNYYDGEDFFTIIKSYDNGSDLVPAFSKAGISDYNLNSPMSVDELSTERSSAFSIKLDDTPLYRRFNNENIGEVEIGTDSLLFYERYRDEYLMDETNENFQNEGINYLGIWSKDKAEGKLAFHVDTAWVNRGLGYIKPQYLISVSRNDFGGQEAQRCPLDHNHGYAADGTPLDEWTCSHATPAIPGFERGKYLVSFADSVAKYDGADDNTLALPYLDDRQAYTRVGFVEAIKKGDSLYILPAAYQALENSEIDFEALEKLNKELVDNFDANNIDEETEYPFIINLRKDNHKNVTWSFRYVYPNKALEVTEEGADNSFLFESMAYTEKDGEYTSVANGGAKVDIAPNVAAWLKNQNGCLVLTNELSTFEASSTGGDPALRFNVERKSADDEYATDNEEITVNGVTVIAGDGVVTINGAAGKKVVVSNILGQVVANTVLTSDNATIAAPQGVVVVAVEGEEAVKAIVK